MDDAIGGRFIKESIIGEGNFGTVYRALDSTNKKPVAVKVEKPSIDISQVENEIRVLNALQGNRGFPRLIASGTEDGSMYIAMQLLGPSLEEKFQESKHLFSLMVVLKIAEQILSRIQTLHNKLFIHRDIKPRQFLMSPSAGSPTIYMIDFGLSKCYQNGKMGLHIQYMENRPFVGTANYASINTHMGIQQSRRDDLESYMYMLSYFLNGSLPWLSKDHSISDREIRQIKNRISVNELFRKGPQELVLMMAYIKSMAFEDRPDYDYLMGLIKRMKANVKVEKKRGISTLSVNTIEQKARKVRKAITDPFAEQPDLFKTAKNGEKNKNELLNPGDEEEMKPEPNSAECMTEETEVYPEIKDRNILKTINTKERPQSRSLDIDAMKETQKCYIM
ncbi:unnamed protein product [Blepharisma stoltei]|uniref:Casein kinase I n=1 Tax=Blepharisma stoltei TaxID=1481888 RepID=A0AAU9JI62_9CILI|nr:unnamed protein product [Blepharisma stoltei]